MIGRPMSQSLNLANLVGSRMAWTGVYEIHLCSQEVTYGQLVTEP